MKYLKKPLIALLTGMLTLSAFAYVPEVLRSETPALTDTRMQLQAAEAYTYKTEKANKTYKGKKSTITVKHYYKRVVLNGSGDGVKSINNQLKKYSDSFMKKSATAEAANSDCKNRKENDTYQDYVVQKLRYLSDEVVSIQTESVWYAGGVSNKTVSGYTFNVKTGKRITKLTSLTKTTSLDKIKTSLTKKIKAAGLDASALKDKTASNFNFYMEKSGKVVVCFAPYELNQGGNSVSYTLSGRYEQTDPQALKKLYDDAVKDAVFADLDEICPLVTIDKNSDMVTWNETGDKILLLTWHKYPSS